MEFWFSELHSPYVKFDIKVEKQLFSAQSDYQRIDVFESPEFGKFLTLDGHVIFSEQDCFIYNEMFVDVCKQYFSDTAKGLYDERVHIYNSDALRFLRSQKNVYDLIINDATDPFGASEGLFTREFYGSCFKALKDDGILVYQHGSPFYDEDEEACRSMHKKVFHTFPISRVYQAHIPTSPSGYWLFGFASKKYHPLTDFKPAEWKQKNIHTEYYTTNLHTGAFMLPKYVEELLEQEEI